MIPSPALFGLLALLSAAVVRLMMSAGVVDLPDARKAHDRPVPKGGGLGVVAAVVAGAAVRGAEGLGAFHPLALAAGVGLALLALLDDARDFRFTVKLGAQVVAAVLAVAAGAVLHRVDLPGLGGLELGWWSVPVTLCWILFTTNAVNFIDGLNGLAAGASLLAAAALAALTADAAAAAACLSLAAGLAGFLPFNYPRARIFMGDVGSQLCGFLLAVLSVSGGGVPSLAGPVLLFGILFDVAFTLARRALAGERVWEPHRGHLYQIVQRAGMPAWLVALVHWGFVLWGAAAIAWCGPWAILAAALPQPAWAAYVAVRARQAGIARW